MWLRINCFLVSFKAELFFYINRMIAPWRKVDRNGGFEKCFRARCLLKAELQGHANALTMWN
jgi:hypothetical protein